MAYSAFSVSFGEQPSATKWNTLGSNDADFNTKLTRAGMAVQTVTSASTAVATGTTLMPIDDTIPQNTEGTEFMTLAITPTSATNKLVIEVVAFVSSSVASCQMVVALFQDSTANALAVSDMTLSATATAPATIPLTHSMVSGTTSSTTFKIRIGTNSAGTTTFNGQAGTRLFGAITKSHITITEIVV